MNTIDHLKKREDVDLDPPIYGASVLADSIANGVRLTTLCVKIPRFELPAFNTHRVFSRNSASSRAIPVRKKIEQVRSEPYIPLVFGKNKRGMQSDEEVEAADVAEAEWRQAMRMALVSAEQLMKVGVHKQLANRLLEPFSWQTIIVTATEWANWDALRVSEDAQGEIALAAKNMLDARAVSTPVEMSEGDWHLPLVFSEDIEPRYGSESDLGENMARISAARCARVSYLTHDGVRSLDADFSLYEKLRSKGHMSPLEHPAQVGKLKGATVSAHLGAADLLMRSTVTFVKGRRSNNPFIGPFIGNFRAPWVQLRKTVPNEAVFVGE